ncbi:MAG: glycosyltransferase [Gemmatimonadota bacterium]
MTARVAYVSYDGLLEPLGRAQVLPYVIGLAAAGYCMHVLSFEKPDDLAVPGATDALRARLAEHRVGWTCLSYHRRPSLPATIWDLMQGRRALHRLHAERGLGLVHARSYVAGAMALPLRRHGVPLVFDMRGFWVDERIESGRWPTRGTVVSAARRLERRLLAESDALVHLTNRAKEVVTELGPATTSRQVVVPTCVDLTEFEPKPGVGALRVRRGFDPSRPLLVHAGTVSGWYLGKETLAVGAAFERMGGQFLLLTRERSEAQALAHHAGQSVRVESASRAEMPEWLAMADAGLALVRPTPAKRASAPTRVGEYLAAGLAVAATSGVGDLELQFQGSAAARVFPVPPDPEGIARWLLETARRPDRADEARDLARRHFALPDGLRTLAALYRSMGVLPCA